MPDDKLHVSGEIGPDEEALARELAELGPLMRRQERAEAEMPDPDVVRNLRARLLAAETTVPDPQFARDLRARLTGAGGVRPAAAQRTWRRKAAVWAGATAAALVAVTIAVLGSHRLPPSPGRGTAIVAWAPPAPGAGDLIRGFPFPPTLGGGGAGGGGLISPEVSQFDAPWNAPYPGRLRLSAGRLHGGAANLPAYQLRGPSFDAPLVAKLAQLLGIRARATRAVSAGAIWAVAADGGLPSKQPLHSLAVSTSTGELVYHNTAYQPMAGPPHAPQDRASVVAAARAWLTRLGWPGQDMPLQAAVPLPGGASNAWIVDLGWPHVRGTPTSPAATLLIVPRWHVADARLWPPVARSRPMPARPISMAWAALRRGDIPLAVSVPGTVTGSPGDGRGTVQSVEVVQVLTADVNGILYLVPAYRFAGTAQLQVVPQSGVGPRARPVRATWYAVVPALAR